MSQEEILEALLWPGSVSDSHAPTASNGHPTRCLAALRTLGVQTSQSTCAEAHQPSIMCSMV